MSAPPSLGDLLRQRHDHILRNLQDAGAFISHSTEKGDATERVWLEAFRTYLPGRYEARRGFVIDSQSTYSKQIDIIVHDRFYTPFVLKVGGYHIIPAEGVYAVFEVKQVCYQRNILDAIAKASSVRSLQRRYRKTKEVPNEGAKPILAGLLATRSSFKPPFGDSMNAHLAPDASDPKLDLVCVAESGVAYHREGQLSIQQSGSWIAAFMLNFVGALQSIGTVPPIDISGYDAAVC